MASLSNIRRIVFAHQWQDPAEWVRAMGDLADLTDDEIDDMVDDRALPEPTVGAA